MNKPQHEQRARDDQQGDHTAANPVPDAYEPTVVPVGLSGFTEGMTLTDEQRAAAQQPGPGSHTEPTGDVRTTYQPTVVEPGLTGFTAGLDDEAAPRHDRHDRR